MPRARSNDPVPSKREGNLTCDGTMEDYRRHVYRGEDICPESRAAWRRAVRYYRYTGVYEDRDPATAHPFMFRSAKPMRRKRNGNYADRKSRKRNDKDPRNRD